MFSPPNSIVPSNNSSPGSDAASATSRASNRNFQHRCPSGRCYTNPSLTDLRYIRTRLRGSICSSSEAVTSSSTSASSGVPGIGYLSGKGVKWVGLQILDAVSFVEMRRRVWIIGRMSKRIDKMAPDKRTIWLLKNERKVNRTIEDLFELSSYVISLVPTELLTFYSMPVNITKQVIWRRL